METGQRYIARDGLSRLVADAAPGWRNRVAASSLQDSQPIRGPGDPHPDAHRRNADCGDPEGTAAHRVASGSAYRRRTAVQQLDGAVSLFTIRTTGWRASQISGLGP